MILTSIVETVRVILRCSRAFALEVRSSGISCTAAETGGNRKRPSADARGALKNKSLQHDDGSVCAKSGVIANMKVGEQGIRREQKMPVVTLGRIGNPAGAGVAVLSTTQSPRLHTVSEQGRFVRTRVTASNSSRMCCVQTGICGGSHCDSSLRPGDRRRIGECPVFKGSLQP